jgi:broad specificity phosphatase PhoE
VKRTNDITTIFTLRHARTAYGEQRRYAGSVDVPLSERGVKECLTAAEALADVKFDVIITSTLRRAVDTARLIACEAPVCVQSKLCNERCFGIMEGLTPEEVRTLEPPVLFIEVGNDVHSVNPAGGESFEDLWERAKKFVRLVLREYKGSTVLVVSHGVFLQMCHGVLRGSNCIESLGTYPGTLELRRFDLAGRRLVSEEVTGLLGASGKSF